MSTVADSPDIIAGKRLLDRVKRNGFVFRRIAPGPDAPLQGVRESAGVARHHPTRRLLQRLLGVAGAPFVAGPAHQRTGADSESGQRARRAQ